MVSGYHDGMKLPRAGAIIAVSVATVLTLAPGSASAATVNIGAVGEISAGALPEPITVGGYTVQITEAAGTYAVPGGYGVITGWAHSTGTGSGVLTFKVYRPTGALRQFRLIGADTQTVAANTVQFFPVRIPVAPGDRIGLSSETVQLAYQTFLPADSVGFFDPDPGLGAIDNTDGQPFSDFKLDVAATVESDVNGDGRGDDTQQSAMASLASASKPRIVPGAFPAAPKGSSATAAKRRRYGAKVTYRVNVPALVRFTVAQTSSGRRQGRGSKARCVRPTRSNRRARRCTRTTTLRGSFTQIAKAGVNSFRFTGRLGGRRLKPGRYLLVATPSANRRTGKPVSAGFRIVR